jgi:hypothetical protein
MALLQATLGDPAGPGILPAQVLHVPTAAPESGGRSEAQREASRRNGAKSRGPRSEAGKARSRGNAVKHGLAGDGVALPEDLGREVADEIAAYERDLAPRGALQRRLAEKLALANVRWSHLAYAEIGRAERNRRHAVADWDAARAAEVAKWMAHLDDAGAPERRDPAAAVAALRGTAAGCDALADAWGVLLDALDAQGGWTGPQAGRAARLLGRAVTAPRDTDSAFWRRFWESARACRPGTTPAIGRGVGPAPDASPQSPADEARRWLRALAGSKIEKLRRRAKRIWRQLDAPDRAGAPVRAFFDPTPEGARLARYLSDADRASRRALAELLRLRRDQGASEEGASEEGVEGSRAFGPGGLAPSGPGVEGSGGRGVQEEGVEGSGGPGVERGEERPESVGDEAKGPGNMGSSGVAGRRETNPAPSARRAGTGAAQLDDWMIWANPDDRATFVPVAITPARRDR